MRYKLRWKKSARDQLTNEWRNAADRNAATLASHVIETTLAAAPHLQGESRAGNDRFWVVEPLTVTYEVRDADRVVRILRIGHL